MWKQSSLLHLVSVLEIERLLKSFVMSIDFFLWFITKDRLNYCWIVSTSKSCWGHLSCGCWAVTGSVMGCPVRLQFRCGPPSLSWSWSCGLPGPSGCHPVLLHCWAQGQLQRDLFQPRRGALLASWESPSVFSFFLVCLPMPCVTRAKVPAVMHCTCPKGCGQLYRNWEARVWKEWSLSRVDFVMQRAVTKQSEFKLRARGIYLTWRAPKRGVFLTKFL